jgi:hypothetical protein
MGMRVQPREFQNLNLRCHTLLSDTVLHDVWAIPLDDGGDGRSVRDAREILFGRRWPPTNMAVRGLFKLRSALGRVFGWDDARHDPPAVSYIHRLDEVDRSKSQVSPGTREGPFRVLYVFADEALTELRNATVHAFMVLALTPRPGGYTLYLAIYVKPVSRFTWIYLAMIDPFRRFIVYPALGRQAQQGWLRANAAALPVAIVLSALMPITHAWADCFGHKPAEAAIVVDRCEVVVPRAHPALRAFADTYPKSFVESARPEAERTVARILDSYRGAILVGRRDRVTSQIFVSSNDSKICSRFKKGVTIHALVVDACCDGDPNPPCHLGFGAYAEKLLP